MKRNPIVRGLKKTLVVAAAIATFMTGSAACAGAESNLAEQVTAVRECDIAVVGAGMSGLSAAVEALNLGADVIVLESQKMAGGNGLVTSCVMGVDTRIQKALGIEVKPADILKAEMETFNYAVDGVRWSTLIRDSAENIEWLIAQGCLIHEDFVDNYKGAGVVNTAHWWVGETQRDGGNGFVNPMVSRVNELGGTILYETAGKQLIQDEQGAVTGVYAVAADGSVLQVNAKAVILATGGFADNKEYLAQLGYKVEETEVFGVAGHNGDGIAMALAAGGKSWLDNASLMEYPMNPEIGRNSSFISRVPKSLWVNGCGQRYVDENCAEMVPARAALAVRSQEVSYALFDQTLMNEAIAGNENNAKLIEKAVADGAILKADTIEELAEAAGIDAATLTETLDTYNVACAAGEDTEFGKKAECLQALENGPFYLTRNSGIYFLTTIGGIDTTPDCEVRAEQGGVIPNLYAVGVDGVMNYKGLYTIDIPGSCNANNIWTGRHAAQMAVSRFGADAQE